MCKDITEQVAQTYKAGDKVRLKESGYRGDGKQYFLRPGSVGTVAEFDVDRACPVQVLFEGQEDDEPWPFKLSEVEPA